MKKELYSILALMLAMTSCHVADGIEEGMFDTRENTLVASLESDDDPSTRTQLGTLAIDGYKNLWSEGDALGIFVDGYNHKSEFKLTEGAGNTTASFGGYGRGDEYIAVYPSANVNELSGRTVKLTLPAEQTYVRGSFGPDSYPMIAVSRTKGMQFRNLCSVLKISLTGLGAVKSIVFTANDKSVFVSGEATVDVDYTDTPQLVMSSGGSNSVTLQCGGQMLNANTPEDFYIVIPSQTYKGGFTLTINTVSGYMTKATQNDVVMERSQLRAVPSFRLHLTEGLIPSETLSGEGTEELPFLIFDIHDLMLMMSAVNSVDAPVQSTESGTETPAQTAHYKLMNNIDLAEYYKYVSSWTPIGDRSSHEKFAFNGVFDGDGHTISNVQIDTKADYQGLFGYAPSGVIRNLTAGGKVKGGSFTGVICGYNDSLIENCIATGSAEGSYALGGIAGSGRDIFNCTNNAAITAGSSMGGIAGVDNGIIKNCTNTVGLPSDNEYIGGICGYKTGGAVYNCSFEADYLSGKQYAGGICGYAGKGAVIANCCSAGSPFTYNSYVGGIVGFCDADNLGDSNDYNTTVVNCIHASSIMSYELPEYQGGISGLNRGTIKNCYWLYDMYSTTTKHIGTDEGISGRIFMLSADQMSGKSDNSSPLYTDREHLSYTNVIDALNAWACENAPEGDFYYGWKAGNGGHPVFTKVEAEHPGNGVLSTTRVLKLTHLLTIFSIPTITGNGANGDIDWGDANSSPYKTGLSHTYTSLSTGTKEYSVTITLEKAESVTLNNLVGVSSIDLSDF